MRHRAFRAAAMIVACGVVLTLATACLFTPSGTEVADITVTAAVGLAREGKVREVLVDGTAFTLVLHDGGRRRGIIEAPDTLEKEFREAGVSGVPIRAK